MAAQVSELQSKCNPIGGLALYPTSGAPCGNFVPISSDFSEYWQVMKGYLVSVAATVTKLATNDGLCMMSTKQKQPSC